VARELAAAGHDTLPTFDLPRGNRTPDRDLAGLALQGDRVLVTKDRDFVVSHLLRGEPPKLLLVTTGNIGNDALSRLLAANLPAMVDALGHHGFVELSATAITIHS
jgi:predicted nuclease of predicted toxin-antitoxin system